MSHDGGGAGGASAGAELASMRRRVSRFVAGQRLPQVRADLRRLVFAGALTRARAVAMWDTLRACDLSMGDDSPSVRRIMAQIEVLKKERLPQLSGGANMGGGVRAPLGHVSRKRARAILDGVYGPACSA